MGSPGAVTRCLQPRALQLWLRGRAGTPRTRASPPVQVCLQQHMGFVKDVVGGCAGSTSWRNWGSNAPTVQHSGHFTVLEARTSTWGI